MDNLYGLKNSDIEKITEELSKEVEVELAILFGSRAKGNFKPGSDVDIVLKGEKLNQKNVSNVSFTLNEDSLMPYKFDILNFTDITNKELLEHINRVGIIFYKRDVHLASH